MKNWSDDGKVHYNAATNQKYTLVRLKFEHHGRRKIELCIPLYMRPFLKSEHYDQSVILAKRVIDEQIVRCALNGEFRTESINRNANFMATVAVLEQLYNQFHLAQAAAGNNVWATPELMQDVGPKPEDDFIN